MKYRQLLFFILCAPLLAFADNSRDFSFSTPCNRDNDIVTLSFVGDILIHKPLYQGVVSGSKHFSQIWKKTNPLIQKADFSVANLEGPSAMGVDIHGKDHGDIGFVYDDFVYSGTNMVFNYHPRILADLKDSGYDMLTLANNHALDRGSLGIDKTITSAREVGLETIGTRRSDEQNANFYDIVKIKNMRIAFLACTEMINGNSDRKSQILLCYRNETLDLIKDLSLRSDVDAVIVYPHWGIEYQPLPDANQTAYAKRFIDAGAVAVIGSHPHVLEPWEKYTTKDGREGLIVYALGNFVAFQKDIPRKTGTVAYLGLIRAGNQKAKIFGVAYTPTFRSEMELSPVGQNSSKDVLNYAASNFGTKNRLEPEQSLLGKICH